MLAIMSPGEFLMMIAFFLSLIFMIGVFAAKKAMQDPETKDGVKNAGKTLGKAAVEMLLRKMSGK